MIPAGYMAKRIAVRPEWLEVLHIQDIFSVSGCTSTDFADYVTYWRHNGFWLFDSPQLIKNVTGEHSISLEGMSLFYYEVHELQYDGAEWRPFVSELSFQANVSLPARKTLEGFDVVTFAAGNGPECSPLSCNSLAQTLSTNQHCLFKSFEEAQTALIEGAFHDSEPGPYRIFAVYSVPWI